MSKKNSKKNSKKKSKRTILIKRKPIIKGTRNIRNKRLLAKNTKKKRKTKNKRKKKYRGGMDGGPDPKRQHTNPTPIDIIDAANNGHSEMVAALLDQGADINIQNNDGWTALMAAASNGYGGIVAALLNLGADIEARSNDGNTAFAIAVKSEKIEIIKILHNHNANVNTQDNNGHTPIMIAAMKAIQTKDNTIVENLLVLNPMPNLLLKDNHGDSVLILTIKEIGWQSEEDYLPPENITLIDMIIFYSSPHREEFLDMEDEHGRTAFMILADWNHADEITWDPAVSRSKRVFGGPRHYDNYHMEENDDY